MKHYYVYQSQTGRIVKSGCCQEEVLPLMASAGEAVVELESPLPPSQYHDLVTGSLMTLGPQPSASHVWDWTSRSWQVDLVVAREARWTEMKLARQEAIDAPLVTAYGTFDSDPEARDNIAKTAQGVQTFAGSLAPTQLPTVDFTLWDDSVVTLTAQEMIQVAKLLFEKTQAAYARGRQVREAIDFAGSAEAIESVTW